MRPLKLFNIVCAVFVAFMLTFMVLIVTTTARINRQMDALVSPQAVSVTINVRTPSQVRTMLHALLPAMPGAGMHWEPRRPR